MTDKIGLNKIETQVNVISSSISEQNVLKSPSINIQEKNTKPQNDILRETRSVKIQTKTIAEKLKKKEVPNKENEINVTPEKTHPNKMNSNISKALPLQSNKSISPNSKILIKPENKEILIVKSYIKNKQDRTSYSFNPETDRISPSNTPKKLQYDQKITPHPGKYVPIYSEETVRRNVSKYLLHYRYQVKKDKPTEDKVVRSPWDDLNAEKFKLISHKPKPKVHVVDSKDYVKKRVILNLPYKKRFMGINPIIEKPKTYAFERFDYVTTKNTKQLEVIPSTNVTILAKSAPQNRTRVWRKLFPVNNNIKHAASTSKEVPSVHIKPSISKSKEEYVNEKIVAGPSQLKSQFLATNTNSTVEVTNQSKETNLPLSEVDKAKNGTDNEKLNYPILQNIFKKVKLPISNVETKSTFANTKEETMSERLRSSSLKSNKVLNAFNKNLTKNKENEDNKNVKTATSDTLHKQKLAISEIKTRSAATKPNEQIKMSSINQKNDVLQYQNLPRLRNERKTAVVKSKEETTFKQLSSISTRPKPNLPVLESVKKVTSKSTEKSRGQLNSSPLKQNQSNIITRDKAKVAAAETKKENLEVSSCKQNQSLLGIRAKSTTSKSIDKIKEQLKISPLSQNKSNTLLRNKPKATVVDEKEETVSKRLKISSNNTSGKQKQPYFGTKTNPALAKSKENSTKNTLFSINKNTTDVSSTRNLPLSEVNTNSRVKTKKPRTNKIRIVPTIRNKKSNTYKLNLSLSGIVVKSSGVVKLKRGIRKSLRFSLVIQNATNLPKMRARQPKFRITSSNNTHKININTDKNTKKQVISSNENTAAEISAKPGPSTEHTIDNKSQELINKKVRFIPNDVLNKPNEGTLAKENNKTNLSNPGGVTKSASSNQNSIFVLRKPETRSIDSIDNKLKNITNNELRSSTSNLNKTNDIPNIQNNRNLVEQKEIRNLKVVTSVLPNQNSTINVLHKPAVETVHTTDNNNSGKKEISSLTSNPNNANDLPNRQKTGNPATQNNKRKLPQSEAKSANDNNNKTMKVSPSNTKILPIILHNTKYIILTDSKEINKTNLNNNSSSNKDNVLPYHLRSSSQKQVTKPVTKEATNKKQKQAPKQKPNTQKNSDKQPTKVQKQTMSLKAKEKLRKMEDRKRELKKKILKEIEDSIAKKKKLASIDSTTINTDGISQKDLENTTIKDVNLETEQNSSSKCSEPIISAEENPVINTKEHTAKIPVIPYEEHSNIPAAEKTIISKEEHLITPFGETSIISTEERSYNPVEENHIDATEIPSHIPVGESSFIHSGEQSNILADENNVISTEEYSNIAVKDNSVIKENPNIPITPTEDHVEETPIIPTQENSNIPVGETSIIPSAEHIISPTCEHPNIATEEHSNLSAGEIQNIKKEKNSSDAIDNLNSSATNLKEFANAEPNLYTRTFVPHSNPDLSNESSSCNETISINQENNDNVPQRINRKINTNSLHKSEDIHNLKNSLSLIEGQNTNTIEESTKEKQNIRESNEGTKIEEIWKEENRNTEERQDEIQNLEVSRTEEQSTQECSEESQNTGKPMEVIQNTENWTEGIRNTEEWPDENHKTEVSTKEEQNIIEWSEENQKNEEKHNTEVSRTEMHNPQKNQFTKEFFENNMNSLCICLENTHISDNEEGNQIKQKSKKPIIKRRRLYFFGVNKRNVVYFKLRPKSNTSTNVFSQNRKPKVNENKASNKEQLVYKEDFSFYYKFRSKHDNTSTNKTIYQTKNSKGNENNENIVLPNTSNEEQMECSTSNQVDKADTSIPNKKTIEKQQNAKELKDKINENNNFEDTNPHEYEPWYENSEFSFEPNVPFDIFDSE